MSQQCLVINLPTLARQSQQQHTVVRFAGLIPRQHNNRVLSGELYVASDVIPVHAFGLRVVWGRIPIDVMSQPRRFIFGARQRVPPSEELKIDGADRT